MVQGIPDVYRQETDFLYKKKKKNTHTQFELKLFKSVFKLFAAKNPKYDHLLAMDPLLKI